MFLIKAISRKAINVLLILYLIFFVGCDNNEAIIIKYNKKITHIKCLKLIIFPPSRLIRNTLLSLYHFTNSCDYELRVSKKSKIMCNSNQNADKKALTNFPSSYIRFDLSKRTDPIYGYYKDLDTDVTKDNIEEGFKQLSSDLILD